jgi:hypothetical protein
MARLIDLFLVPFEDSDLCPAQRVPISRKKAKRLSWFRSACRENNASVLWQLLVEWGADPNQLMRIRQPDDEMTWRMSPLAIVILHATPESAYLKCLETLLRAGANPTLLGFESNPHPGFARGFLRFFVRGGIGGRGNAARNVERP